MEPLTETDQEHDYCPDSAIKLTPEAKKRKDSMAEAAFIALPGALFRRRLSSIAINQEWRVCSFRRPLMILLNFKIKQLTCIYYHRTSNISANSLRGSQLIVRKQQ